MFDKSILSEKKNNRPLAFLISIGAELIVVSVLILIPLAYNEQLPGFGWKNIGLGAPQKPIQPQRIAAQPSQHASSSSMFHPRFIYSSLPRLHDASPTSFAPESIEVPSIAGGLELAGPSHGPTIEIAMRPPAVAPPPAPEPAPVAQPRGPIRVVSEVQMAKLVRKIVPSYPPLARSARVSGVVRLIGIIARDGTIRNVQVVSGHPLLTRAALEAVQQWVYQPTLLNGEPVEVIAPIDVNFTLADR